MKSTFAIVALAGMLVAVAADAQLVPRLPSVAAPLGGVAGVIDRATSLAPPLADLRREKITALLRAYPDLIALDPAGFPARAHEVIVSDPDDALVMAAQAKGYRLIERDETLGIGFARFAAPAGISLKSAIRAIAGLGAKGVSADQLHFASGTAAAAPAEPDHGDGPLLGMIDGGVAGPVERQRGFAEGAPRASDHGTAIASLIAGSGAVRGAAPGARLLVADVYGADPAGGSATAIAKALAWLVTEGSPVITISLVGPSNLLLARVVAAAQARGTIIVAAVGNDGPASSPSYPASYPGVIAVTGVDGRNRVLLEAGRATHLDYAAPGADMVAADLRGGVSPVRGTSYAAPLVAATIARLYSRQDPALRAAAVRSADGQARRLGPAYGRGLLCEACRTAPR